MGSALGLDSGWASSELSRVKTSVGKLSCTTLRVVIPAARSVVIPAARSVVIPAARSVVIPAARSVVIPAARSVVIPAARSVVIPAARSVVQLRASMALLWYSLGRRRF